MPEAADTEILYWTVYFVACLLFLGVFFKTMLTAHWRVR